MSEKSIRYLVYATKAGLFILPVLSLIVAGSLFFPFISGKNFFFRIMVEILLFLWVFAACFDKNYRPRKSPILIAISATLFFLTLATILGANPYRSFWSNYERMEGLVGHIHLFLYFLVLTSVFKKEKDWKRFFTGLIGMSFILAIYGFLQFFGFFEIHQGGARLDATLGNATYFAIFLVFHLFLIAWLFGRSKNLWIRSGLGALFVFELILVFMTATRGAVLGFMGGAAIFGILMAIFSRNKKIRYGALGLFVLIALFAATFILVKNTALVRNNYIFSRFADMSFSEKTVQSRLTIWQMAFKGFLERPILGWGPENFSLVFNKYYEPKLWKQEPWFDRAHNIIFDWLISSGILGFLAYWSIWGAAVYVLIKGYKKNIFTSLEVALFAGLFGAYAFHNLFVFDNLTSYYLFFSVLGYIHFRHQSDQIKDKEQLKEMPNQEIGLSHYFLITASFLAMVFSLYFINFKPYLAGRQLLNTLGALRSQGLNVDFILKEFDKVFAYKTFGTSEAREQLGGYAEQISQVPQISNKDKMKVFAKAINEMESQIKEAPRDARGYLFLSSLYTKANRPDDSLKTALKALELSPAKQQIFFIIADIYLSSGQYEKAFEILKKVYDSDPTYHEATKNLAIAAILTDRQNYAEELFASAKKIHGGFVYTMKTGFQVLNAYARAGNYEKVKEIWLYRIKDEPNNAQYRVNLAATYLQLGQRNNAVGELEKAAELNPEFKQQAEYFINEIKAGRNP